MIRWDVKRAAVLLRHPSRPSTWRGICLPIFIMRTSRNWSLL